MLWEILIFELFSVAIIAPGYIFGGSHRSYSFYDEQDLNLKDYFLRIILEALCQHRNLLARLISDIAYPIQSIHSDPDQPPWIHLLLVSSQLMLAAQLNLVVAAVVMPLELVIHLAQRSLATSRN